MRNKPSFPGDIKNRLDSGGMCKKIKTNIIAVLIILIVGMALNLNLLKRGIPIDERATQNLPDRIFNTRALIKGNLPLWNPYLFFGSPHIATHQSSFFYPLNIILFILFPPIFAFKISSALHFLLAGIFMFLYLRRLRLHPFGAAFGGIVYVMSGYLISHECHTANHNSVVWLPLLFYFVEGVLRRNSRRSFVGGSLVFAVMVFSGYMHTVVITGFYILFYLVFYALFVPRKNSWKKVLPVFFMLAVGIGISGVQILTTHGILDYTKRQSISYQDFCSGYFPLSYLPQMFFPFLFGAPYPRDIYTKYCGVHFFQEIFGWIGVLPLVLAGMGFWALKKGRRRYFSLAWTVIGFVSLILCFGPQNPLYKITYHIPGYNLFKGPAKNWLGVHLATAALCGAGVHILVVLLKKRPLQFRRLVLKCATTMLVIGELMAFFIFCLHLLKVKTWPQCFTPDFGAYFYWRNPAVWLPILVVGGNAVIFYFLASIRRSFVIFLFLPLLIAHSLFVKHNMFIQPMPMESVYKNPEKNPVFSFLRKKEKDLNVFRIYPIRLRVGDGIEELLYPCINEVYEVRSLSGYGPLFHKDLSRLTDIHSTGISYRLEHLIRQNRILSMLNVKYLLIFPVEERFREAVEFLETTTFPDSPQKRVYKELFRSQRDTRIYENLRAVPYAFSISRFVVPPGYEKKPPDFDGYVKWLYQWDTEFNPRTEALLMEPKPEQFPEEFSPAKVDLVRFRQNRIEAEVDAEGPAFIVFSELFYPGWHARVDGKKTKLYRVNVLCCGVPVPRGKHNIILYYLPSAFIRGAVVSVFSLLFLMGFIVFGRTRRKEHPKRATPQF